MAQEDDEIRRLVVELRVMEGSARALQSRLDILGAAMREITLAYTTLEGLKAQNEGVETLVPVGAGSYIRARVADVRKIVMGVGAGVAVEKDIEESVNDLKSRLAELERVQTSLQEQLSQLLIKLEEGRERLGELIRKRGGATAPVAG